MRQARKTRQEGAQAADAAMHQKNADIDRQKKELAKKRMSFLMKQADVFGKFIGADAMRKCAVLHHCAVPAHENAVSPVRSPAVCVGAARA